MSRRRCCCGCSTPGDCVASGLLGGNVYLTIPEGFVPYTHFEQPMCNAAPIAGNYILAWDYMLQHFRYWTLLTGQCWDFGGLGGVPWPVHLLLTLHIGCDGAGRCYASAIVAAYTSAPRNQWLFEKIGTPKAATALTLDFKSYFEYPIYNTVPFRPDRPASLTYRFTPP